MYRLCMSLGALAAHVSAVIAAREPWAKLSGPTGESPCCIAQKLNAPCYSVQGNCNDFMGPNLGTDCTCNTVLFNLWSACLQSRNEATLPFANWTAPCAENLIQITYGDYPMHGAAKGMDIPTWAYVSVTPDGKYDSSAVLKKAASGWTLLQIITPVILGVSLLSLFVFFLWWYRKYLRNKYDSQGGKHRNTWAWVRMLRLWPSSAGSSASKSAIVGSGGSTWVIDDFDTAMMTRRSPDSDEYSDFDPLSPSQSYPFPNPASQLLEQAPPHEPRGQHVRPLGKVRKSSGPPSWVPFTTSSSSGSSFWRNPFKKRPKQVTSTTARRGFRVDEADLSTAAAESRRPTLAPSSSGHDHSARHAEQERERLSGVGEEGVEGDGMGEDSVLLISHGPGMSVPSAISTEEQQRRDQDMNEIELNVVPPSRNTTVAVTNPARASSPTLPPALTPLTALIPLPSRTPTPTWPVVQAPTPVNIHSLTLFPTPDAHDNSHSRPVPRPLPTPGQLPAPLSSPPSYYSQHPPLHHLQIPNYRTNASPSPPEECASPPYFPNRNLSPGNPYLTPRSRNVSSESIGLIRPARADPINLVPASVRAAGYSPYARLSQTDLGSSGTGNI